MKPVATGGNPPKKSKPNFVKGVPYEPPAPKARPYTFHPDGTFTH